MKRISVGLSIAFVLLMAALCAMHGFDSLMVPVSHIRQTILWMADDTVAERLGALLHDNRPADAALYRMIHDSALAFILAMALAGLALGFTGGRQPKLPMRQAKLLILGMGGLAMLSPLMRPLMDRAAAIPGAQPVLVAMPAYWLAGLVLSASVLGCYMLLGCHDLALLARDRLIPLIVQNLRANTLPAD